MTTEIIFPGSVPGNNGKQGLLRMHWRQRKKLSKLYLLTALSTTRHQHTGPVRMELVRHTVTGKAIDHDNLVSTGFSDENFKHRGHANTFLISDNLQFIKGLLR